jgi:hypothetical protein
MTTHSSPCHVNGRPRGEELWMLRSIGAASSEQAACGVHGVAEQGRISTSRAPDRRPWQIPSSQAVATMSASSTKQPRHQISHHHSHNEPELDWLHERRSHGSVKSHLHSSDRRRRWRALTRPPRGNAGSPENSEHDSARGIARRSRWCRRR